MLTLIVFLSPVLFLILLGILIRARGNPETAGRRYFLFLVWITIGSLAMTLLDWVFSRRLFNFGMVLFPVLPGLLVLTLLHGRAWTSLGRGAKIPILCAVGILLVSSLAQLVRILLKSDLDQLEALFFGMALLAVSMFLFIVWTWGNRFPLLLFVINVVYLTMFLAFDVGSLSLFTDLAPGQMEVHILGALVYLALPGMTIPVMAVLTAGALNPPSATGEAKPVSGGASLGRLLLVIILFGYLLYTFRWLWLWDGIDDGIRGLFMILAAAIATISAGMILTMLATGWRRWMGLLFAGSVLIPTYLMGMTGFASGGEITNYTVTQQRAVRIQQAIETYRMKTGHYPVRLAELVPVDLWRIPLPMIMPNQNWCYEGGPNHYRLGAVYREHWSSPYLEVRVYASAGTVPEGTWECDERLAEAIAQSGFSGPPPTPVPLPTSAVPVPRLIVEPIVQAESFSLSSWSPEGTFLAFGLTDYFMTDGIEHVTIDLRFLDASSGEICRPGQSTWTVKESNGLRGHSAWLSGGRFLYVTDAGEMVAFTPCVEEGEDLASRYPVTFTQIMSSDQPGEHILLKNEEAYWLMDGIRLTVSRIEGIPTESYRPLYAWAPGGKRLAMSLMGGPEVEDEAFLYIVDAASAQVEHIIPLEGASDANLPWVEWLTRDDLLVCGKTVTVLDFRSDPPATTDVLKDIFLLDIAYPDDVWGLDTVSKEGGEEFFLGVQANHPRNADAYVYSSETGEVEIFHHDVSTLIFFPGGQWMRLLKWEDPPAFRDEYELVWMDHAVAATRLNVDGHLPRAHPQLFPKYLPESSQLIFSSSQGISLVSIPDGTTTRFWELASKAEYFDVIPVPSGEGMIVASDRDGLYYIPLLER